MDDKEVFITTNIHDAMESKEALALVNLRVIGKLKSGDRLQCADCRFFGIDRGHFDWLWRWFRVDSRATAVDRIEDTFCVAISMLDHNMSVLALLQNAQTGVEELMQTYSDDPTTVARLETLVETATVAIQTRGRSL